MSSLRVVLSCAGVCLVGCVGLAVELPSLDGGAGLDGGGFDAGGNGAGGGTGDEGGGTGGGGSSGGGPGSGGGVAGLGGGGGGDGCPARFCEDFERFELGAPPGSPWTRSTSAGAGITVDSSRAHGGQRAARVTTDGLANYRQAYLGLGAPFFPVAGNGFYGRVWFYLTAAPAMTTHWTNISGEGTAMNGATPFRAYVRYGGQVKKQLMANYDSSVFSSDCWRHSQLAFPEARWSCFEWHFDGPSHRMELWVDGAAVTAVSIEGAGDGCIAQGLDGRWILPQFETLRLGWEHYQASIPIELFMDDVALDVARVGCD